MNDGSIDVAMIFNQKLTLSSRTEYRVFGAYFHDSSVESKFFTPLPAQSDSIYASDSEDKSYCQQTKENANYNETKEDLANEDILQKATSKITVQHGFPSQNFLLLLGDINVMLVQGNKKWKSYKLTPDSQLLTFFYHPFSQTFLGITKC